MKTPLVIICIMVIGMVGFIIVYSQSGHPERPAGVAPTHEQAGGYGGQPAGGYGAAAGGYGAAGGGEYIYWDGKEWVKGIPPADK